MYGLVNKGIRDLIIELRGPRAWTVIRQDAGVEYDDFKSLSTYPDKITYDLVGSASKHLGMEPNDVLRAFGKFWILYTAKAGYGPLMSLFGQNLKRCLINLNNMHGRMGAMMPNLVPPRFNFQEINEKEGLLFYHSERPGLMPMVLGLIEGLAEKFDEKVTVVIEQKTSSDQDGAPAAAVRITWQ